MKPIHPECPCCLCGIIELTWSDRIANVDPEDHTDVAERVIACALDHSYDRTDTGVPYGIHDTIRDALAPVVAKHLSAIREDWKDHSVSMNEEQRKAFRTDLLAVLATGPKSVCDPMPGFVFDRTHYKWVREEISK